MGAKKMLYYRVKPEYDNMPQRKLKKHYMLKPGIWTGNELYTPCELNQLKKKGIIVPENIFEEVEIKKTETYWFFGSRFSNHTGVILPF